MKIKPAGINKTPKFAKGKVDRKKVAHEEYDSLLDIPPVKRQGYDTMFGVPVHVSHIHAGWIDVSEMDRVMAIIYEFDPKFVNRNMGGLRAQGKRIVEERKAQREERLRKQLGVQ